MIMKLSFLDTVITLSINTCLLFKKSCNLCSTPPHIEISYRRKITSLPANKITYERFPLLKYFNYEAQCPSPALSIDIHLRTFFTYPVTSSYTCFLQRPNSWKKSRRKSSEFSFLFFTVTSAVLSWDFYFFKLKQPL
jgi:hypothetical protein